MEWLNYHHLLYFWVVAREGTIRKASQILRLAPPTISGQLRALETAWGEQLFERRGRRLVLTDVGQLAFGYADAIFTMGRELQEVLRGHGGTRPARLRVGVSDVVPKLIAYRLLAPGVRPRGSVHLQVREDTTASLLASLATHEIDLVLADEPVAPGASVRAFNHVLGECGVTFFAHERVASRLRGGFPRCLDRAPLLLPLPSAPLRRALDRYFDAAGVRPQIVAEFEDSALMKVFGGEGEGVFPGPTAIEREIRAHYDVTAVGRTDEVRERYYAITVERRIKHPSVQAITEAARERLFEAR